MTDTPTGATRLFPMIGDPSSTWSLWPVSPGPSATATTTRSASVLDNRYCRGKTVRTRATWSRNSVM
jgi:hypothetical protein